MKITNTLFKNILGATIAATAISVGVPAIKAQNKTEGSTNTTLVANNHSTLNCDTVDFAFKVPPKGTVDNAILKKAPNSEIYLKGEKKTASIIVDLSKNVLYQYNPEGSPICAYLVASGKKASPTDEGLRVVTHIESYPYKTAPKATKRYKKPWDYGPRIICLEKLDSISGRTAPTGEFIHGNNNPKSLGKYASLGCIRMDNDIIRKLAKEVKRGDLVLIKRF